jgi:hypothetical protein
MYGMKESQQNIPLRRWTIHDNINPENLHCIEWVWNVHEGSECDEAKGGNTSTQLEANKVPNIVENPFSLFNGRSVDQISICQSTCTFTGERGYESLHNSFEVIIYKNHVSRFLTNVRPTLSHCNPNIGFLQGHSIIHTIP